MTDIEIYHSLVSKTQFFVPLIVFQHHAVFGININEANTHEPRDHV